MGLTTGLDAARSSLATVGEQISIVSRNIANVGNADATRRVAKVVSTGNGVTVARIDRAYNAQLLDKYLSSTSDSASHGAVLSSLTRIQATIGEPELGRSPAALIAQLGAALTRYAGNPQQASVGAAAVNAARDLANSLNEGSASVDAVRRQADTDIKSSVKKINDLLAKFGELNNQIVNGSHNTDQTELLDARDTIVKQLSAEIGVRPLSRPDGDMALFTDSGVVLFDKVPRSVTFSPSPSLNSGATGNAVYVDGVPVAGDQSVMTISSGRIAGLVEVRDTVAPAYQRQLDEMARGLIEAFAEFDQSATPTLPAAAGLFTYSGGPTLPPTGTVVPGLAGMIRINANVDPAQGGNPALLRDGGISNPGNPAYVYNATGSAAFTDRLNDLVDALDVARPFDPSVQASGTASLSSLSTDSVSWLEELRQAATTEADYRATLAQRSQSALEKDTGVSLDEEMTNMLSLERSFQASSRIIATIDEMLASLMAAVS